VSFGLGGRATMEEGSGFESLDAAFSDVMTPWRRPTLPAVVLFSGGVDSGTIAWELRERPAVLLSTLGIRGSADLAAAEESSRLTGLPWVPREVEPSDVRAMATRIEPYRDDWTPTERSVQTAFALAVETAPPGTVLCGQGADELFLGYAHFRGLDEKGALSRAEADLDHALRHAWPLSQRIAADMGRSVVAPYLDPRFVAAARSIPIDLRLHGGAPKAFFRRWASRRGVPSVITARPKRALQFGSGVDRVLTGIARSR
jgi:asparagine synthase (glutamine-hydrolysing)